MEVVDVEPGQNELLLRMPVQHAPGGVEKAGAVIQVGERVVLVDMLHLADQVELAADDDVFQADHQNLGVVGLGDEVPGAQVQHLLLRLPLPGGGDGHHRQRGEGGAFKRFQEPVAVQLGHDKIQQNGGHAAVLLQNFQSAPAVFGLRHVVFLLQNAAQNLAVDGLVLHDQNGLSLFIHSSAPIFLRRVFQRTPSSDAGKNLIWEGRPGAVSGSFSLRTSDGRPD